WTSRAVPHLATRRGCWTSRPVLAIGANKKSRVAAKFFPARAFAHPRVQGEKQFAPPLRAEKDVKPPRRLSRSSVGLRYRIEKLPAARRTVTGNPGKRCDLCVCRVAAADMGHSACRDGAARRSDTRRVRARSDAGVRRMPRRRAIRKWPPSLQLGADTGKG